MHRDTALASAVEGLLVADRAGVFTYANPAAEKILGLPAEQIVHHSCEAWKVAAPDGTAVPVEELPVARVLRTGEPAASVEHALERPDGTWAIVSHHATATRDSNGTPGGAVVSLIDVTERSRADERMRRAELGFRAFIERTPSGVGMHRRGQIVYVNPAIVRMLGYDRADELVGRPILDVVYPDDREAVQARVKAMVEDQHAVPVLQERFLRRDGEVVDVEVSALPIAFEGEPTVFVMAVDVSDRCRFQRDLDRSLSLLRATLESTADGILVVDKEGRISVYNEKFLEMWRLPREILDAGDDQRALAHVAAQVKEPEAFFSRIRELYKNPASTSNDVIELRDGRTYERYSQAQQIGGQSVGRVWSFRNVTARRNAEAERERLLAEISEKHDLLQAIHANMVDGLTVCDAEGRVTLLNDAQVRLFGADREAAIGQPLAAMAELAGLTLPDGRPVKGEELPLARALAGETVIGATFRATKTGREIYVRSNATPIRDARGAIVGAVAVNSDVSEVVEFDRMKDQFVRVAAHELKTPVAILKGYAQLLLRGKEQLPMAPRGAVEAIERGADRINAIVTDLLDVSQLHLGHLEIRREKIDLGQLVDVVSRRFVLATAEPRHRIAVTSTCNVMVHADRARLEQVLAHLVDNAVRYSPLGGEIEISVAREEHAAVVCVRDHGVGIPLESQARIFECFYRAHTDTPHDYGGMGVGLYIAHEIVTRHGGTMWFESAPQRGSTFCFSLPV